MKLYTVYFSPTGGTKKVLDELVKEWLINDGAPDESGKTSTELVEIDLSDRTRSGAFLSHATPGREDFCIIAVPSFGGRVPAAALERLTQLKAGHLPFLSQHTETVPVTIHYWSCRKRRNTAVFALLQQSPPLRSIPSCISTAQAARTPRTKLN